MAMCDDHPLMQDDRDRREDNSPRHQMTVTCDRCATHIGTDGNFCDDCADEVGRYRESDEPLIDGELVSLDEE